MRDSNYRPIRKILVDPEYSKLRIWLAVALLVLGVTLIAVFLGRNLSVEPGWITVKIDAQNSCSGDFYFQYYLGDSGQAPNIEKQTLADAYDRVARDAYQIFHESESFEGVNNVQYLNAHPNETVEVPAVLYQAFALLEQYQNRALYLAPVYDHYVGMFLCDDDWAAKLYDPKQDADAAKYIADALAYASDEQMVKLELLGGNQVKLNVADAYLQFAKANEITEFIDFYWLKNAFIVDYMAEELEAAGFTGGIISSFDGFQRNLGATKGSYSQNLFDRVGDTVYQTAVFTYEDISALVSLRDFPGSQLAVQQYFAWDNGEITSCHIDIADGMSKTAAGELLGYSKTNSCAQILLELYPIYVADTLDTKALTALPAKGIDTIYAENFVIYTSDASAKLSQLYTLDGVSYKRNG